MKHFRMAPTLSQTHSLRWLFNVVIAWCISAVLHNWVHSFSHSAVSQGWMTHDLLHSNTFYLQLYQVLTVNQQLATTMQQASPQFTDWCKFDMAERMMRLLSGCIQVAAGRSSKNWIVEHLFLLNCLSGVGLGRGTFKHRVPSTGNARLKCIWNARC